MSPEQVRQAWGGRVSEWQDPLDAPMAEIAARYGLRVPRRDVVVVDAVRAALDLPRPRLTVVVVGSNGKTSTATYLSDLFTAAGLRTGLYTSPHIAYWGERVRIDDVPVDGGGLIQAVRDVDALVTAGALRDERLRFFDVLTLAAARLFADADVDVAVYEAGIGGRADPTRCLHPELVVLSSVGLEHTQLLGDSEGEILLHKLDVAPAGSTLVAGELPPDLLRVAADRAAALGVALDPAGEDQPVRERLPSYLAHNWNLARRAAAVGLEWLGRELPDALAPREVYGRFTDVTRDGVEYVLDVAHNPQAWAAFLGELRGRLRGAPAIAVAAVTTERSLDEFADAVVASGLFLSVYATTATVRPTHDPDLLAAALAGRGVRAAAVSLSRDALARASAEAGDAGATVAIFGSTFLVTDALAWLGEPPRFGSAVAQQREYARPT